jgi:uncharacterized protein
MPPIRATLLTLALAATGGGLFALLGLPAAWLAGAMTAVAVAGLAGAPVGVPGRLREAAFILVGASMGGAVTPETLGQMAQWPLSLALLAASVAATIITVALYLERVRGWEHATARFSAVPGALTSVLILAGASSADVPRVAFSQTLRLFVLVALTPPLVGLLGEADGDLPAQAPPPPFDPVELAILVAGCLVSALALARLRVPAGALLGAMLCSAVLHGTGLITTGLPAPLILGAFVVTGAAIGERFKGTRFATIRGALRGSIEGVILAILVAGLFAAFGTLVLGIPFGQLWLALAPGGIEAMAILAFLLDLDPAFVGAHHVVRFVGLSLLAPVWRPRRPPGSGST